MGSCVGKNVVSGETEEGFTSGNVRLITDKEDWNEKISEANKNCKTVVANFSASWCGPCKAIAPLYSELSKKHPELVFLTIDTDELNEFCSSWDICATPTFFFLKDGEQIDKLVGSNEPELMEKVAKFANPIDSSH